jgi:hypothetical protein
MLLAIVLCAVADAGAQDSAGDVQSYLEAGEFGPALKAARSIRDVDARDRWLGQIALRQADLGARAASLSTLSAIDSDLARRQAIDSIRGRPFGAAGGAAIADFDTLIELITSTIAPDSWDEVGGAGAIEPFPTGVFVDSSGVMRRLGPSRDTSVLTKIRADASEDSGNRSVRNSSALRKVSLVRLEKQLQLRHAFGLQPDEAMRKLAGIHRVRYLFVYPETGDIVLAGPAGDWRTDSEGRVVNVESGTPVLQLDDFVVVLRNAFEQSGRFGCAIKPKQEHLAGTKAFLDAWRDKKLKPGERDQWLTDLRNSLGKQDIEVWGIDPRTHVARIIVEADYRMKLVGMGLEDGTLGVVSYLESVKRSAPASPPALNVLRWWFTLNYDGVRATEQHHAFQLDGPGAKVLCENELLTDAGERIHTGTSKDLNREFARSFTKHFDLLAEKYPIYAELRNIFDMALIAGLMRTLDLPGQVDWHMTHFQDPAACQVALGPLPREIESVVNSIVLNRTQIIAGVSGGVAVDTNSLVDPQTIKIDDYGLMEAARGSSAPRLDALPPDVWWWD